MTLTAWLLATGSHWGLVQTFAWGRMIAMYSQSMPLAQAIHLTFTAENMCGVCEAVQDAKQQDSDAPEVNPWFRRERAPPGVMRAAPLTSPPRLA